MVPSILRISDADTVLAKRHWSRVAWTLVYIFGREATIKSCIWKCIPMNSKSWVGVNSDFSKLAQHSDDNLCMGNLYISVVSPPRWANLRGRREIPAVVAATSASGDWWTPLVTSPVQNGRQVNWYGRWLMQKCRNFHTTWVTGT